MWEQVKTNKSGIILLLNYEDFASIEVKKRLTSSSLTEYEISFHIERVSDQSVVAYKLDDVKKVLEKAKEMIEILYDEMDYYTNSDIYDFLDEFVEAINDF